mmetsp:Transcript_45125/g.141457  ORF Transcript_45125/g.141457 Transcript_45125/m.141457 type:complete len:279 (-) Transcript_45125:29-865(-)
MWPCPAAAYIAVMPSLAAWFASAPASRRNFATSRWPEADARIKGDQPSWATRETSARALTSTSTLFRWPLEEDMKTGVRPSRPQASVSAPAAHRRRRTLTRHRHAAINSGVMPSYFALSASAFTSSKNSMTSKWPRADASQIAVRPISSWKSGSVAEYMARRTCCRLPCSEKRSNSGPFSELMLMTTRVRSSGWGRGGSGDSQVRIAEFEVPAIIKRWVYADMPNSPANRCWSSNARLPCGMLSSVKGWPATLRTRTWRGGSSVSTSSNIWSTIARRN